MLLAVKEGYEATAALVDSFCMDDVYSRAHARWQTLLRSQDLCACCRQTGALVPVRLISEKNKLFIVLMLLHMA